MWKQLAVSTTVLIQMQDKCLHIIQPISRNGDLRTGVLYMRSATLMENLYTLCLYSYIQKVSCINLYGNHIHVAINMCMLMSIVWLTPALSLMLIPAPLSTRHSTVRS